MKLEELYTMRRPERERRAPSVPVRRAAALVAVLAYPVMTLGGEWDLGWMRDAVGPVGYALLLGALVLVWGISFMTIAAFRRQLAQAPDHQLDERERAVRDEAHVISHRLMGGVLAFGTVWSLVVAPFFGMDREVSLDVVLATFFSLVTISVVLPSAVVAWRDTDEDDVDDDGRPDGGTPDGSAADGLAPIDQASGAGQGR